MILGKITGKLSTLNFDFIVENLARKFEYVKVAHIEYGFVLCQIVELERDPEKIIAKCSIIGYKDNEGRIRQIRTPFEPGTEVLKADDEFISDIIKINTKEGAYLGKLDGKGIDIYLDLRNLLTKHVSILAKSGSGKSYTSGVLIEEIIEKKVPLLIIDPHGEYTALKYPNDNLTSDRFEISPASFVDEIREYGDITLDSSLIPLKLNINLKAEEIMHILPAKLSGTQTSILYSVLQGMNSISFEELILELQSLDSPMKWSIINSIEYIKNLNLFSSASTPYNELIKPNRCSIINLKGIDPEIQEIIVYKLMKDLFEERKKEKIPPFFAVIEEAHNFLPERSFGEAKSSKIMRLIASEGRKFGLGLCIISQRPARCDKSVLSQCSTQIILKITNPNDLKAISNSAEGISFDTEKEIQNLAIGTAMVTGIVDMPLFVNIRPRKTKHGGTAVDMLNIKEENNNSDDSDKTKDIFSKIENFKDTLPIIKPKISIKDLTLMHNDKIKITSYLIPAVIFNCSIENTDFNLLIELFKNTIIPNTEEDKNYDIPNLNLYSPSEIELIKEASISGLKASTLMLKFNIGLFNAQNMLDNLVKKGALIKNTKDYSLNPKLNILKNIKQYQFLGKMEYTNIEYDKMLPKNSDSAFIKSLIEKFVNIKDLKECYILHYMVEKIE